MLYLNSIENAEASPTEKKFAICHEEVSSMQNVPELAPSRELLARWESKEIGWEDFREQFKKEMKTEYLRDKKSRLRRLAKRSLEIDISLHSPEPSGEQTYRTILEEIINAIWQQKKRAERVINLAREPVEGVQLTETDQGQMETIPQEDEQKSELQEDFARFISEMSKTNENIKSLQGMITTKDEQIQSLQTENRNKDTKNDELRQQVDQIQEINTHPGIREIAVKATRGNPVVFEKDFSTLAIDNNLPIALRTWLEKALRTDRNSQSDLYRLIRDHTDYSIEYSLDGKFDKYDVPLADVIRTQRNLIAHPERMDERTKMARVLCCFFAAALLSPKLSKADHTNTEPLKSIKPTPNDAEVHYSYGLAYRKKGDHDRAIAEYTKAISLKPDHAGAYRNRGTAYYHKGNYASAIKDYTKAIELRPNYAEVYYDRGTAYYRKGDYNRAIAEYTKAIELKPNYVKAYNNRGHAHQQQGDSVRAQADFDKAEQLEK